MITTRKTYSPLVKCDHWESFVQFSKKPKIVVYNLRIAEGSFHIYAIKEKVFTYKETFPFSQKTEVTKNGSKWKFQSYKTDHEGQPKNKSDLVVFSRQPLQKKLECGLLYSVTPKLSRKEGKWMIEFRYELNPETMAEFLSETLKISKDRVIEGDVYSF